MMTKRKLYQTLMNHLMIPLQLSTWKNAIVKFATSSNLSGQSIAAIATDVHVPLTITVRGSVFYSFPNLSF
jgi:hypothetical protein